MKALLLFFAFFASLLFVNSSSVAWAQQSGEPLGVTLCGKWLGGTTEEAERWLACRKAVDEGRHPVQIRALQILEERLRQDEARRRLEEQQAREAQRREQERQRLIELKERRVRALEEAAQAQRDAAQAQRDAAQAQEEIRQRIINNPAGDSSQNPPPVGGGDRESALVYACGSKGFSVNFVTGNCIGAGGREVNPHNLYPPFMAPLPNPDPNELIQRCGALGRAADFVTGRCM